MSLPEKRKNNRNGGREERGMERQVTKDLVGVHSKLFRFYKLPPRPQGSQPQVAFDFIGS